MIESYIRNILTASVYEVAKETPLELASRLSARLGQRLLLKREDLQSVFSFKLRGAYNKISKLTEAEKKRGIIAASAGNHAQGVALAAQKLGIEALIVMPKTTPVIKVKSVQTLGAQTLLVGDSYDEACEHALALAATKNLVFIHPYDDPDVIAGQGTVAREILHQHPGKIDVIFVPVGGGGLIAGIALYAKYLRPEIKIVGVEPDDAACLKVALDAKKRVVLDRVGLFADGVAVRQIGKEPFKIAQAFVDEVITVTSDELCAAIKDCFDDTRAIVEPAGALAIAGAKKYAQTTSEKHQTWVAINSGANMNFDRLRHIAERAELGEQREALFAVTIPEKPGSFRAFCKLLGKRAITEFNYRYSSPQAAHIFVGLELSKGKEERVQILELLQEKGYSVVDMTDNEMAKLHVRYMVGGACPIVLDEALYRFEFPERPGALIQFLNAMPEGYNITLFHYRNQGAAYGRVLIGVDVASGYAKLDEFLGALDSDYPYTCESENPAYDFFL